MTADHRRPERATQAEWRLVMEELQRCGFCAKPLDAAGRCPDCDRRAGWGWSTPLAVLLVFVAVVIVGVVLIVLAGIGARA